MVRILDDGFRETGHQHDHLGQLRAMSHDRATIANRLILAGTRDSPRISALFAPSFPNLAFVHAVLQRKIPGRVWLEQTGDRLRSCLITTDSPFCFIGGEMTHESIDEALTLLRARPPITLVCPRELDIDARAAAYGFAVSERVQFSTTTTEAGRAALEVPKPYRVARIDAELFPKILWRPMVLGIFGSRESYLEHHYGFCVVLDGQIVAEAHGIVAGGLVEFGSFTHSEHRRRGLTNIATGQLIAHAKAVGHRAIATCAAEKVESVGLITKAGLLRNFHYRVLTLAAERQ